MPDIYDRFSAEAMHVMRRSRQMIEEAGERQVLPEHYLTAMSDLVHCDARNALEKHGVNFRLLLQRLGATRSEWPSGQLSDQPVRSYMSVAARTVIDQALMEATMGADLTITTRHLLLGVYSVPNRPGIDLLAAQKVELEALRRYNSPSVERGGDRQEQVVTGNPFAISPVFLGILAVTVATGWATYAQITESGFFVFLFVVCGWLLSLAMHEFGHALVAYYAGDRSVAKKGYLTLNPLKYTHPLLSIALPMFWLIIGGIGLPGGAVYIDTRAIKKERSLSYISAAGPLGTVAFAFVLVIPFLYTALFVPWLPYEHPQLWAGLGLLFFFQITSLVINLLPLPGLDGYGILEPFLPPQTRMTLRSVSGLSFLLIFFLFMQDTPIRYFFWDFIFRCVTFFPIDPGFVGLGFELFRFWEIF